MKDAGDGSGSGAGKYNHNGRGDGNRRSADGSAPHCSADLELPTVFDEEAMIDVAMHGNVRCA